MKFLIIFLFFAAPLFSQNLSQLLYSEIHVIPADSLNNIYYIYKIPFNRLVFQKDNDNYSAEFSIAIEVTDSIGNFITRQIKEKRITSDNFEGTNKNNIYTEGIIEFKIGSGKYILAPVFTDFKSDREIKLANAAVNSSVTASGNPSRSYRGEILSPLIINSNPFQCEGSPSKILANFEGNVPFDREEYDLVIPSKDNSEKIIITIINNKDTLINEEVKESFYSDFSFEECGGKIIFNNNEKPFGVKYFLLRNFSRNLEEGDLKIIISKDEDPSLAKSFYKNVKWYNKPLSLNKPELAIRMLKHIENEDIINNLLQKDSDNYSEVLFDYWKKYDPTSGTSFNQLMEEYYQRVDYAARTFNSISGRSGIESDRGKIFIQFGKPKIIERSSNQLGKVIETWTYEKADRRFVFIDEKGTGDFFLKNG